MKKDSLSILVTGVGAPGIRGTLHALRTNPDKRPVRVLGVDISRDAVGRCMVDEFCSVPSPEDATYAEVLVDLCRRKNVAVIVPQTTREIVTLSVERPRFEAAGIAVVVSDRESIAAANNKYHVLRCFQKIGLPHPEFDVARSVEELAAIARRLGYPDRPVVVKPAVSNGMRGVRVLRENAWDVHRFFSEKPSGLEIALDQLVAILGQGENWPELIVSEYLPGAEYSVDAFVGRGFRAAYPRRRMAIRSGISFDTVLEQREDMANYTLLAADALRLRYAFGFQFKLDDHGIPKVLECNPRVQGTMVASVLAGANVIWWSVLESLGEPVEPPAQPVANARFQRYWGGVAIGERHVAEI
jgi:carbamoyl-phosphate synthase large subunit